jgi:hypothetical protein
VTVLGDAAEQYAERGWSVHPLKPGDKKPASPHGFLDATTDLDQVRAWWKRCDRYNIGLRTGIAFDVLDLDGPNVFDTLDELGAQHTGSVECGTITGPTVLTPRGAHIYVQITGRGNTTAIRPGIDWRGENGYVVAPPSVRDDGRDYAWGITYGPDTPLEPAPQWLLDAWDKRSGNVASATPAALLTQLADRSGYGAHALESELGRLATTPNGARNHNLNRAAFRLGQLVASGDLGAADVAGALLTVAMRIGLTETEAIGTIRSGMSNGMRTPRRSIA